MGKPIRLPDITHEGEPYPWGTHRPSYSLDCPHCTARRERNQRITKLHAAFVDFGYTDLTREETAAAYDLAMAGPVDGSGDIIAMLTRRQLEEAGLVQ